MDTVCGLSLTSSGVGWVLVEGHAADGAILDHGEFSVRSGGGGRAVETSKQVADAGRVMGVIVHDHIVVGRDGVASLKSLGLF